MRYKISPQIIMKWSMPLLTGLLFSGIATSEILETTNVKNNTAVVNTSPKSLQLQCWQFGKLIINEQGLTESAAEGKVSVTKPVISMKRLNNGQIVQVVAPIEGLTCLLK
jgi:hypothetical protein